MHSEADGVIESLKRQNLLMILVLDLVHWMWMRIINFKIQFKRLVEYIPKRCKYHVHKIHVKLLF
jgi:hypothetical protein